MFNKIIINVKKNLPVYFDILFALFFTIALMYKSWYFQNSSNFVHYASDSAEHDTLVFKSIVYCSIIVTALIFGIFKKRKLLVFFILSGVIGFWIGMDTLYYRYYTAPTSISMIDQISFIGDIHSSTDSLFLTRDWLFFLDIPVYLIAFIIQIVLAKKNKEKNVEYRYILRKIAIPIAILSIVFSIFSIKSIYTETNNIMFNYDKSLAAKDMGILYYHFFDLKQVSADEITRRIPVSATEKEKITSYFEEKSNAKPSIPKYQGIANGRNVIIIQCEALQSIAIERSLNDEEITPFLNNLIKDSAYFNNMYHQVAGGNTVDAEFLMNNSLYPVKSGAVYFRYPNNTYMSLPGVLNNSDLGDYNCYAAHAYKPSFWNRLEFYPNDGFDEFFSMDNYIVDEKIGWALSDESFFKQNIEKIDKENPFYLFNVTLSNHHPYDGFMHIDNFDITGYEDTQLGNYFKGAHYTDVCIEKLFDDLKERGLYDNSVIIIYGDHSALFRDQKDDVTRFLDFDYNEFDWEKIQQDPFILHVPNSDLRVRVDNVCGQIDMMPTLANLMNLDMPYAMGKDMLNLPDDYGYAVLRNSSVITDDFMYLTDFNTCYNMKTGEVIDKALYEDEINKLQNDLNISDLIIGKNYLKNLMD